MALKGIANCLWYNIKISCITRIAFILIDYDEFYVEKLGHTLILYDLKINMSSIINLD